jgi:hypothetical protein
MKLDYGGRNFKTIICQHMIYDRTESQRFAKWVRFAFSCVEEKKNS